MSELLPVLQTLVADADAGRTDVLCTVLRTRGSTPQSPGATMLLRGDYDTVGTLGGGCVEAEVRRRAYEMSLSGQSGLLDYVLDHDYGYDDGLICGGRMFVGVMPIDPTTDLMPYRQAIDAAARRQSAHFPLRIEEEGQPRLYRIQLEIPPTVLIAGAGHVGLALAKLLIELDFHVVVIDDRADLASRQRFGERVELVVGDIAESLRRLATDPHTYVVIVTRGHKHDHQALEAVIDSPAGYVGLIGSKRKSRMILSDLAKTGVTQDRIDRVHTPIGLPIGAVTVPEIAISIAAQLVQSRRTATPSLVEGPLDIQTAQTL